MSGLEATITGMEDLEKALKNLKKKVSGPAADGIVKGAAEFLQGEIRANVYRTVNRKTGNLAKAVVVRKMTHPGVFVVAMDRKIAHHAPFVEFGHSGGAAPHPYFRPAVDAGLSKAARLIESETTKAVES